MWLINLNFEIVARVQKKKKIQRFLSWKADCGFILWLVLSVFFKVICFQTYENSSVHLDCDRKFVLFPIANSSGIPGQAPVAFP